MNSSNSDDIDELRHEGGRKESHHCRAHEVPQVGEQTGTERNPKFESNIIIIIIIKTQNTRGYLHIHISTQTYCKEWRLVTVINCNRVVNGNFLLSKNL